MAVNMHLYFDSKSLSPGQGLGFFRFLDEPSIFCVTKRKDYPRLYSRCISSPSANSEIGMPVIQIETLGLMN